MTKRYLFLFLATAHLALIMLYNVHSLLSEHGYRFLEPYFRTIEKSPIIQQHLIWSGTETVYGFFAPRVGSQHMLLLHSRGTSNADVLIDYPLFNSREAKFRYISFLAQLEDRLRNKDPLIQAYGRALLKGLVSQYKMREGAKSVKSLSLYVVVQPKLAEPAAPNVYKKIYDLPIQ